MTHCRTPGPEQMKKSTSSSTSSSAWRRCGTGSSTAPRPTRCPCRSRGGWADYHIAFTWIEDVEALHVACAFDLKVPERRRAEVLQLIALVNEQIWVGHFDMWSAENVVMFRHALLLAGGAEPTHGQCETHAARSRSRPASAISRPSSSSSGPARAPARRSTACCSRPKARRERVAYRDSLADGIDVLRPRDRLSQPSSAPSFSSAPARWAARCSRAGSAVGREPSARHGDRPGALRRDAGLCAARAASRSIPASPGPAEVRRARRSSRRRCRRGPDHRAARRPGDAPRLDPRRQDHRRPARAAFPARGRSCGRCRTCPPSIGRGATGAPRARR